jgi:hypothetical protein
MNALTKRGQFALINIHRKLGMISASTAEKLKDQKNEEFKKQAKKLADMKLSPSYTYDPIDAETGRRISVKDLERHVFYLTKTNNKNEANRIKKIMGNMRMPGASKTIELEIKMIPKARTLNMLAGERVYSVTESERIPQNQHSLEIPSRSIAGEDQPNQKLLTPIKKPVTQSLRALSRGVSALQQQWKGLYDQAVAEGKGMDIRLNMTIGSIRDLTNEINEADKTGKNPGEIENKLQMLKEEYLKSMKDLSRLVRRS